MTNDLFLTLNRTSLRLRVSAQTLKRWAAKQLISHRRYGDTILFPRTSIESLHQQLLTHPLDLTTARRLLKNKVTAAQLKRLVDQGYIPGIVIGDWYRFNQSALDAYLQAHPEGPTQLTPAKRRPTSLPRPSKVRKPRWGTTTVAQRIGRNTKWVKRITAGWDVARTPGGHRRFTEQEVATLESLARSLRQRKA